MGFHIKECGTPPTKQVVLEWRGNPLRRVLFIKFMSKVINHLSAVNHFRASHHFPALNLSHQLKLFAKMVDQIRDELILIRGDGQIVYVNEAAMNGLGYSHQTLLTQNILSFYKERMTLREWREKYLNPLKKNKKPIEYKIERIVKGGQVQSIQVIAVYMNFQSEDYILSIGRDISEKIDMQVSLKESQDRYRLISEGAADGIFTIDLKGRFTYANRALSDLVGIKLKEALGTHFRDYVVKSSLSKAIHCFEMAKAGHARIHEEIKLWPGTKRSFLWRSAFHHY